jgi:hypothetical protein
MRVGKGAVRCRAHQLVPRKNMVGTAQERLLPTLPGLPGQSQILPAASFWIRLAISISRRQARSINDITRSMS